MHGEDASLATHLSFIFDDTFSYSWKQLFTWAPLLAQCKESPANAGDSGSIPGLGRSLDKEMATHSSILAWEIPCTEEPDKLQSMGSEESDTT